MSSIFSFGFEKNLERIHASTQRQDKSEKQTGNQSKAFSEVLADVEKGRNKTNNTSAIGSQRARLSAELSNTEQSKENFSNLQTIEENYIQDARNIDAKGANRHIAGTDNTSISTDFSVKTFIGDVKMASSPPPAENSVTPPSAPEILSARWVNKGTVDKSDQKSTNFSKNEIENIIRTAGRYHGVDPDLSLAVAHNESALAPHAVSKDGHDSKGIFQLLDSTGREMLERLSAEDNYAPFDPGMNAFLGVGYLRRLLDIFSAETKLSSNLKTIPAKSAAQLEKLAIAAFNAGEGNVARAQARALELGKDPTNYSAIEEHLPQGTRLYVDRVLNTKNELQEFSEASSLA